MIVDRLVMPQGLGEWRSLRLSCGDLQLQQDAYHCRALTISVETPQGDQQIQGEARYRDAQHWSVALTGLRLAGGQWQVRGEASGDWQLSLEGQGATVAGLLELAPASGLPPWGWRGRTQVRAQLTGAGADVSRMKIDARLRNAGWSDAEGLQAAEKVTGQLSIDATRVAGGWDAQLHSEWPSGQLYSDPVFVELDKHPLRLRASLHWPDTGELLQFDHLSLTLGQLLQATAQGELPPAEPLQGTLQLRAELPDLSAAYPVLLQPFGYGRAFGALEVAGAAQASVLWRQGQAADASLRLSDVHADDREGRFGLAGVDAALYWVANGEAPASQLQWQSGRLYDVALGGSRAALSLAGDRVALTAPLLLPLLDGSLNVPELQLGGLLTGATTWRTVLQAEALSLPALTHALGWPELSGTLSVQIPAVEYAAGVLQMQGELVAQAFDGTVRVSGLELRQPLGPAPIFQAQASIRGLDLERLTQVFDFGRITGRLDGDVRGLQLVAWEPTAFEAELRNPARDDLPHRISQRAVENLTALGNNGAVALSGTFLRFFESFSYDRMLLKVRLAGQRAELDGIPHASGGYYLVKGAGLPRIDVIGRNRQVAWRDLVERLRRISLEGAQVR
jgi:hypothetical protein